MQDTMRLYRTLFATRAYLRSLCEGAAFLSASSIAIFAAVTYATVHASNHVTDFVLSRVGPYNVRFLFVYGTFTAFVITAGLLAFRPNRLPFALGVDVRCGGGVRLLRHQNGRPRNQLYCRAKYRRVNYATPRSFFPCPWIVVLTRFPDANRCPLRLKTL